MSVFCNQILQARLQEYMLYTCILDTKPGKLDIKRREHGTLFIGLQVGPLFQLAILTWLCSFPNIRDSW